MGQIVEGGVRGKLGDLLWVMRNSKMYRAQQFFQCKRGSMLC